MPDWIVLIRPLPLAGETVISETHVGLEIIFGLLLNRPPVGCSGIIIRGTRSVRNHTDPSWVVLGYS